MLHCYTLFLHKPTLTIFVSFPILHFEKTSQDVLTSSAFRQSYCLVRVLKCFMSMHSHIPYITIRYETIIKNDDLMTDKVIYLILLKDCRLLDKSDRDITSCSPSSRFVENNINL